MQKVKDLWANRVRPFYWQEALFSALMRPFVQTAKLLTSWRRVRRYFRCGSKFEKPDLLEVLRAAWYARKWAEKEFGIPPNDEFDYEYIWWNAWLYSASKTLWAGLIKELYVATEKHFGDDYANARLKANFYRALFQGLVTEALLGLSIFLATFHVEYEVVKFSQVIAPVISGLACVLTGLSAVLGYLNAAGRASEDVAKEVASPGFKEKLGFMTIIKDKLFELGGQLKNPETVNNVWDFLLPEWLGSNKDWVKRLCERLFGGGVKRRSLKPCRFIIFIDDLDRCPRRSVWRCYSP